jgi:hypothetical protein
MKFMLSWRIAPGNHKPAAEGFMKTRAPMPAGLRLVGRWHAPGSVQGWALVEADDARAVYHHVAEWANLLSFDVTPVVEDPEAGESLAVVYGC